MILSVMASRPKVLYRNTSPSGWWIFKEVEQWVSKRQKKLSDNSRCFVWENTRLIRAKNREEAYRKALKLARFGHPIKFKGGEWRFVGISMLLPVHEDLEDGAEILWADHGLMRVSKIKKLIKTKQQLPVFNDSEESE